MLPIRGLYEIAVPVKDLASAETFYREVLGPEVGLRDVSERRKWLFLRAGGQAGMIVLQETKEKFAPLHFAFTIAAADVASVAAALQNQGVAIDGPHFHEWMPRIPFLSTIPLGTN